MRNIKSIKDDREFLGLTQQELAVELGISISTISNWERGKTKPRKRLIKDLESLVRKENLRLKRTKGKY